MPKAGNILLKAFCNEVPPQNYRCPTCGESLEVPVNQQKSKTKKLKYGGYYNGKG